MENFGGDLEPKRLDLTWSGKVDSVDLTAATLRSRERLEAFEMWVWRRMLKVSWVDKVSNAEVLQKVQENKSILDTVHCTTLQTRIGHILRNHFYVI